MFLGKELVDGEREALLALVRQRVAIAQEAYCREQRHVSSSSNAAMLFVLLSPQPPEGVPAASQQQDDGEAEVGATARVVVSCRGYVRPPRDEPVAVAVLGPPRPARLAQVTND